jgi:hypothetical protein
VFKAFDTASNVGKLRDDAKMQQTPAKSVQKGQRSKKKITPTIHHYFYHYYVLNRLIIVWEELEEI